MILETMALELGLPIHFIANLAKSASYEYKTYQIPKRTGGFRTIHHPSRRLKALQRWLLENIVKELPVHRAAAAYQPGSSIFHHAKKHVASRYLLRMDLTDFFPSIKKDDIKNFMASQAALFSTWSPLDHEAFCNIVVRNGALTIGAPTSPSLSNAICYEMDVQLDTVCSRSLVNYTRYADDLFFSSERPGVLKPIESEVTNIISALKMPANLKINKAKTRHSSKRGSRRVTGITLGSDGNLYIGRHLKRVIRSSIHRFDVLDERAKAKLCGLTSYAVGFDPEFLNSLIQKYGLSTVREAMQKTT